MLFTFTTFEAVTVSSVCAMYAERGLADLVAFSIAMTACIFFALSLIAHHGACDYSFLGTFLTNAMLVLLGLCIYVTFVPTAFVDLLISFLGTSIFSGLILYDTSIMKLHMTPDDAVEACVQLYLDILNLFLYLLQLLSQFRES